MLLSPALKLLSCPLPCPQTSRRCPRPRWSRPGVITLLTVAHRCCLGRVWVSTGRQVGRDGAPTARTRLGTWPLPQYQCIMSHHTPEPREEIRKLRTLHHPHRIIRPGQTGREGHWPCLTNTVSQGLQTSQDAKLHKLITSERWTGRQRSCWINYWTKSRSTNTWLL